MKYFFCCPYCGKVLSNHNNTNASNETELKKYCLFCDKELDTVVKSKFERNYYTSMAKDKFPVGVMVRGGDGIFRWREILEEEVFKNPLFDKEKYKERLKEEEKNRNRVINTSQQCNLPKCPTCGSTRISKISATSKVVGASLFGLFSKTATSQFKCNNCGYKW